MIIFLYGDDAFRSREKLLELKSAYEQKNAGGVGLFEYDFSSDTPGSFITSLEEQGLFATKKLVIAKKVLAAGEAVRKPVTEFLENRIDALESDRDTILVFWEDSMPKKNLTLFKLLEKKVAKKQCFESLRGVLLEQWILKRARQKNATMILEKAAMTKLAVEMEGDLFRLDNELEKLVNFCESGTIHLSDVDLFVGNSTRSNVFEALEALSSNNKSLALKLFAEQREKGENDLKLLSMCAWQLRNLLRALESYDQGMRTAPLLARHLKMHPFVAQKLLRQIPRLSPDRLKQAFSLLAGFDLQSKTGVIDPKLALDMFVMKF